MKAKNHRPATRRTAIPPGYPKEVLPIHVLEWQREMNVGRTWEGSPDAHKRIKT